MTAGIGVVLMPFWVSTILLNGYVSAALIRRIYRTAKSCKYIMSVGRLHFFIRVVSESGVLYFSITFAHFLSRFGTSKFATNIISVLNAPVIGIAFNWFLIRVAINKAIEAAKEAYRDQQKGISTIRFNGPPADGALSDDACAETGVIISTVVVSAGE
ncbi:hypothetical protein P691DRAFT_761480 [Macrolepiota fuliginosa MF-IS2]|uniref:Uncharacterized protein n=1 Tax=Macrolepiota fuliginosa MF-IS2 TaxID=1400762 RepID=A0A9P5X8T3_9AGAR|nr:hypothetical protein P691DRAFT_761480 [Macrolepiota fuliginosa MF-IS2]